MLFLSILDTNILYRLSWHSMFRYQIRMRDNFDHSPHLRLQPVKEVILPQLAIDSCKVAARAHLVVNIILEPKDHGLTESHYLVD